MKPMSKEQRRQELIAGLKNTGNEVVYVAINHVAEVLGIEKAEELHNEGTLAETREAVRIKRNGDGTREVQKVLRSGNAEFDRAALLEALEASVNKEEAKKVEPLVAAKIQQGEEVGKVPVQSTGSLVKGETAEAAQQPASAPKQSVPPAPKA